MQRIIVNLYADDAMILVYLKKGDKMKTYYENDAY